MRTLLLGILVLVAVGISPAKAFVRFDFEQPYFIEEQPNICKDHALIRHDGLYHIFYIHSLPPPPEWNLRYEGWLGHLTSPDLRHWTRQDSILPVTEVPDTWEDGFIWAPKVMGSPYGEGWWMYYTGVSYPQIAQQTGLAMSLDLFDWARSPDNPIFRPGEWSDWNENEWSDCRDPEIFEEDGLWYLLNTCTSAEELGAISIASSEDLVDWEDLGPMLLNDSHRVFESVQLLKESGTYHLFFTEQEVGFTTHLSSSTLMGGWDLEDKTFFDIGAAPEISRLEGETIFSRHMGNPSVLGSFYCYRFDHIDMESDDQVPKVVSLQGLQDHWSVMFGDAFDNQPTFMDNPLERGEVSSNLEGNSYAATYESYRFPHDGMPGQTVGGAPRGAIRSTNFTVSGNRIRLLVGGGLDPDQIFVVLVRDSDSRVVFWETGEDSHAMSLRLWDTSALIGQEVYLVVADLASDSLGFISADSIEEYEELETDPIPPSTPLTDGPFIWELVTETSVGEGGHETFPPAQAARLLNPHPNPFNPRTYLRYEIDSSGLLALEIVDASGRRVRSFAGRRVDPGPGYFVWNGVDDAGRPCASGVYLAALSLDGSRVDARRLLLLR